MFTNTIKRINFEFISSILINKLITIIKRSLHKMEVVNYPNV